MARIPGPDAVTGPASLRGGGPLAQVDTSGLERGRAQFAAGVQNLASGFNSLSGSLDQIAAQEKQRQNVSDIAKAEALWTKGSLDMGNRADTDGDWRTYDKRYGGESVKLKDAAGAMIRDEDTRARFLEQTELRRLTTLDSINDRGRMLSHQEDRVTFDEALVASAELISEPSVGPVVREKARADVRGSIEMAVQSGLITPLEGAARKDKFLDGADELLAENRAMLDIVAGDPRRVMTGLGISEAVIGGSNLAGAALNAAGGAVVLSPEVAAMAAQAMGDTALPNDPALAKAYLKDPEMNARYVTAAIDALTDRYKGDVTAAVIAVAPGGGLALAEQWVKSSHDEAVLPRGVRDFYRKSFEGMSVEADMRKMPVVAADDVDLERVDVAVLDRWEQVQSAFGTQLPVISGFRTPEHNDEVGGAGKSQHIEGRAVDIDVSSLSEDERVRLIATASAMGFTGIGVYKGSIHLDAGERRAWGPSYGRESVPEWAEAAIDQHVSGDIADIPINVQGVSPEYRALPFDKRLTLYARAKQEVDRQALDMRGGIEIAAENAPVAIMANGAYDGEMPKVDDFVEAWGALEGIERFKAFDASVDVAEAVFGMRTMSNDDIATTVEAAVPQSTGDMAAIEQKRFDSIQKASETILTQREKDPAAYVMGNFPNVAAVWEAVAQDPSQLPRALTLTAEAQKQLGIDKLRLLPEAASKKIADTFNSDDPAVSQEQRVDAVVGAVFASNVEAQRDAIFDQLVASGVPGHVRGAMAAMERGDTGAASYLFRAAIVDPAALKVKTDDSRSVINQEIWEKLFDEGEVGDVKYGISDGLAENFVRVGEDRTLIERAVMLHLADGSAQNTDQAINLVRKEMWGDVRVVTGKSWGFGAGLKIILPSDEPEEPMRKGFNALLGSVGEALMETITARMAGAATSNSELAIMTSGRDNSVSMVLEEGYFTNFGDGDQYVFIDPASGEGVNSPNGEPLVFTRADVLAAGEDADAVRAEQFDELVRETLP